MRTIHKYKLEVTDNQTIKMPGGAEIIHADVVKSEIFIFWAIVNTDSPIDVSELDTN